jgi:hypothetical protein
MPDEIVPKPPEPETRTARGLRAVKVVPKKSTTQVIGETLVDVLAISGVVWLAHGGRVDGNFALFVVALLAGVRAADILGFTGKLGGGGPAAILISLGTAAAHAIQRGLHG